MVLLRMNVPGTKASGCPWKEIASRSEEAGEVDGTCGG